MLEILRFVKGLTNWVWTHRAKILVLILVMTMVVPQPAKGQFIDVAAIVSAIGAINTAITNVIGAGLRDISGALGAVNGVLNAIQNFFQNTIYRSEEHTSELQSLRHLVCRLLLEKKKLHKTASLSTI